MDTILLMDGVKDDAMSDDEATNNNQRIIQETFIAIIYVSFSSQCTTMVETLYMNDPNLGWMILSFCMFDVRAVRRLRDNQWILSNTSGGRRTYESWEINQSQEVPLPGSGNFSKHKPLLTSIHTAIATTVVVL